MAIFLYGDFYPFQQGILCYIQVTDSLGILLHSNSRMNIKYAWNMNFLCVFALDLL